MLTAKSDLRLSLVIAVHTLLPIHSVRRQVTLAPVLHLETPSMRYMRLRIEFLPASIGRHDEVTSTEASLHVTSAAKRKRRKKCDFETGQPQELDTSQSGKSSRLESKLRETNETAL
jgi:hypothetical protein